MKQFNARALLVEAGAVLVVVGVIVLFQPLQLLGTIGLSLSAEPTLMSELRSPGGFLIVCGTIVFLGAFRENLTHLALWLSILVYGTFGVSRLISVAIDGVPSTSMLVAMGIELVTAALSMLVIIGEGGKRSIVLAQPIEE